MPAGRRARALPRGRARAAAAAGGAGSPPQRRRTGAAAAGPRREEAERATAAWVRGVVVGHGLCPWAGPLLDAGGEAATAEGFPLRVRAVAGAGPRAVAAAVREEAGRLLRQRAEDAATTLLVLRPPPGEAGVSWNAFYSNVVPRAKLAAKAAAADGGAEGSVQVVPFHPDATFSGERELGDPASPADGDAYDYAARSPFPVLHLLRERDVRAAEAQLARRGETVADVKDRNARLLRDLGVPALERLLRSCLDGSEAAGPSDDAGRDAGQLAGNLAGEPEAVGRLKAWLTELGADRAVLSRVEVRARTGPPARDRRRWFAVAGPTGLAAGEGAVEVPEAALMTARTARACAEVRAAEAQTPGGLSQWRALLLHLLVERRKGAASFWGPYLASLPAEQAGHPLFAGAQDLAALGGTGLGRALARRSVSCEQDHRALEAAGARVSLAEVRWAAATLASRAFSLSFGAEPELSLVPLADLLDHDPAAPPEAELAWDAAAGAARLRATRAVAPGEEVRDSYGQRLSASDLLVDYGFWTDDAGVVDRASVPASLLAAHAGGGPLPRAPACRGLLAALGLPPAADADLPLEAGADALDVALGRLRLLLAAPAEVAAAGWGPPAAREDGEEEDAAAAAAARLAAPGGVTPETEQAARAALGGALQQLLGEYPAALRTFGYAVRGRLTPAEADVFRVLRSEVRAVQAAQAALHALEEGGEEEGEEPVAFDELASFEAGAGRARRSRAGG